MKCSKCQTYVCICETTFSDMDLNKILDRHHSNIDEDDSFNDDDEFEDLQVAPIRAL